MYKPQPKERTTPLFWELESMLDSRHELYVLSNLIDWDSFEKAFAPLFVENNGRPAKPIRLMTGLLILKHLRNVSDEAVVEQFKENAYYQYFCGEQSFTTAAPCAASELVHFRKRIKEEGMELILKESIRVNLAIEDARKSEKDKDEGKDGRGRKPDDELTAFIDTTVQEKNITFPTDSKLLNKVIAYCRKVAAKEGTHVRQSYSRELKGLKLAQRFRGRSHSVKKVAKADRRMRTIAGRLVRELQRELPERNPYKERLELCLKFVNGEKVDGHKIYSLHEPDVLCVSKGKEHKKYEFGNKVSVVRHWSGLIIGALSFRNEFDGHTVDESLKQVGRVYGRKVKVLAGDRGYRGLEKSGDTTVMIPDVPKPTDSQHIKGKKHKLFRKRAGIEPVIGHCKSDHRLGRNFYKGLFGDSINVMLAAAGFNFKRAIRLLFCPLLSIVDWLLDIFLGWRWSVPGMVPLPATSLQTLPTVQTRVFKG